MNNDLEKELENKTTQELIRIIEILDSELDSLIGFPIDFLSHIGNDNGQTYLDKDEIIELSKQVIRDMHAEIDETRERISERISGKKPPKYSITISNFKDDLDSIKSVIGNQLQLSPLFSFKLNDKQNFKKNNWEMLYYKINEIEKNRIVEISKNYGKSIIDIKKLENKGNE